MALIFPKTTPTCYVSSIVALNIYSPKGTGDWHKHAILGAANPLPEFIYLYGENQRYNTNHLLSQQGIIDGTERLAWLGYTYDNAPIYIADHPRACFDMLYTHSLQTGIVNNIILEDWFPAFEDKQDVYDLIYQAEDKLNHLEKERLQKWKIFNPFQ
ncbi:hypothetical protein EV694_0452 [Volucribacter psittacicida]|uniref:Uncharacterized protein n=1 Tax=Volucribacter psittacicida TaxID=203482 RepID=A0A4R1G2I6_9PAST|nr:hypothetical protein [Volucribacter psittacicida]TCK01818.1 hypothetical protein EV694_0452 [Volucribacter psittacicida]